MTLDEAQRAVDRLRATARGAVLLGRPVGERVLAARLDGSALTVWTESSKVTIKDQIVHITKR